MNKLRKNEMPGPRGEAGAPGDRRTVIAVGGDPADRHPSTGGVVFIPVRRDFGDEKRPHRRTGHIFPADGPKRNLLFPLYLVPITRKKRRGLF